MKLKRPQGSLAWFAAIWFIFGAVSTVLFLLQGKPLPIVLAILSAGVSILAAGLWLTWKWVRIPFTIYWLIIAGFGVLLLFLAPVSIRAVAQIPLALYFAYLVYSWDPEEPELLTLDLSSSSEDQSGTSPGR